LNPPEQNSWVRHCTCPLTLQIVAIRGCVYSTQCLTLRFEWLSLLHGMRMMVRRPEFLIECLSWFSSVSMDNAAIVPYVELVNYRFRPHLSYLLFKNRVIIGRNFACATDSIIYS
jgi:hypothetical protein